MLDGLTLDKVKMAALIITIITTLAGWYQAWVKGGGSHRHPETGNGSGYHLFNTLSLRGV